MQVPNCLSEWPPADVETAPDKDRELAEAADRAFSEADKHGLAVLLTYPPLVRTSKETHE